VEAVRGPPDSGVEVADDDEEDHRKSLEHNGIYIQTLKWTHVFFSNGVISSIHIILVMLLGQP
jgi:hypothetical protein